MFVGLAFQIVRYCICWIHLNDAVVFLDCASIIALRQSSVCIVEALTNDIRVKEEETSNKVEYQSHEF